MKTIVYILHRLNKTPRVSNLGVEGYFGISCFCPFCHETDRDCSDYHFQWDDYVDYPMLWCGCGARSVFLLTEARPISEEEIQIRYPQFQLEKCEILKEPRPDLWSDCRFSYFEVPLAMILRISNHQVEQFHPLLGKQPSVTREQLEHIFQDEEGRDRLLHEMGYQWTKEIREDLDWNLSFEVDSYSVHQPVKPYPINYDLSHDGIHIHLLCRDQQGNEFRCDYWGD